MAGFSKEGAPSVTRQSTFALAGDTFRDLYSAERFAFVLTLIEDVRLSLRALRRERAFIWAAVASIAVGVAPISAAFAVIHAMFLRPPAGVAESDNVHRLLVTRRKGNVRMENSFRVSYPDYLAVRGTGGPIESVGAYFEQQVNLGVGVEARRLHAVFVTADYFSTLRTSPALGRWVDVDNHETSATETDAVLSYEYWKSRHRGDSTILGKAILVSGMSARIVGVAPRGFLGIDQRPVDIWLPIALLGRLDPAFPWFHAPFASWLTVVVRVQGGISDRVAGHSLTMRLRHAAEAQPGLDPRPLASLGSSSAAGGSVDTPAKRIVFSLWICTGALLLVSFMNLASLLLARGLRRQPDLAVSIALGLSSQRLLRQMMIEAIAVAVVGAAVALSIVLALRAVLTSLPILGDFPPIEGHVVAFTIASSLIVASAAAVVPARQFYRGQITEMLQRRTASVARSQTAWQSRLVTTQLVYATVLLIAATQIVRGFWSLVRVDTGMDVNNVAVLSFDLSRVDLAPEEKTAFYSRVHDALSALPGVEHIAAAAYVPFREVSGGSIRLPGREPLRPRIGPYVNFVSPDFFQTLGLDLRAGRAFQPTEGVKAARSAIVNETLARLLWSGSEAVGECVMIGGVPSSTDGCTRVVGVVGNGKYLQLHEASIPHYYLPLSDAPPSSIPKMFVRTRGSAEKTLPALRTEVIRVAPSLPFIDATTLAELVAPQVRPLQLGARVLSLIAATAVVLAALGIYAVLTYVVSQQRREIGIRLAFGASQAHVVRVVVQRAIRIVIVASIIGIILSLLVTTAISKYFVGTEAPPPWTYVVITIALSGVAVLASVRPAFHASRLSPALTVRSEA